MAASITTAAALRTRAFVAINIADSVRDALFAQYQAVFGGHGTALAGVKLTPVKHAADLHITVKFLGDVPHEQIPLVSQALVESVAPFPPFPVQLAPCGAFPGFREPRVLWAGCAVPDVARSLARHVNASLHRVFGFEVETDAWTPHITLARIHSARHRRAIRSVEELLARIVCEGEFLVRSVDLMASDLHAAPGAPRYRVLASAPLNSAVDLLSCAWPPDPPGWAEAVREARARQQQRRQEARERRRAAAAQRVTVQVSGDPHLPISDWVGAELDWSSDADPLPPAPSGSATPESAPPRKRIEVDSGTVSGMDAS